MQPSAATTPHIVVIGGGITGLSAAFRLQEQEQVRVTLVEGAARLGGKIRTERVATPAGPLVVEAGPDSFVAQKPAAIQLARRLGLGDELCRSAAIRPTTMVLKRGRLHALPDGLMLVVPTRFGPFIRSSLISPLGKLRMACDVVLPARRDEGDESLAAFIRRRLGNEVHETLGEPLMAGIHSSDSERQSILATFPRFRELERRYGSLTRGMIAGRRAAQQRSGPPDPFASAPFVTLRGGLSQLTEALIGQLACEVLTNSRVVALNHAPAEAQPYHIVLADGRALHADALIVTAAAGEAAQLLADLRPELARQLRQIRYGSTATISLAYPEAALPTSFAGYGVIIACGEGRRVNACTLSSRKFEGRAPQGTLLARVFVGGARTPEALALADDALVELAHNELCVLTGMRALPSFSMVARWNESTPQYDVGHLERVAALEQACPPGLFLAGAAYRGVGIPDCIQQGQHAADASATYVGSRK